MLTLRVVFLPHSNSVSHNQRRTDHYIMPASLEGLGAQLELARTLQLTLSQASLLTLRLMNTIFRFSSYVQICLSHHKMFSKQ